jgi:hypothetical protein
MAIYGSGVRIAGWTIILPLPETIALTKTRLAVIVWRAADPGTNRLNSVAVPRAFEF